MERQPEQSSQNADGFSSENPSESEPCLDASCIFSLLFYKKRTGDHRTTIGYIQQFTLAAIPIPRQHF